MPSLCNLFSSAFSSSENSSAGASGSSLTSDRPATARLLGLLAVVGGDWMAEAAAEGDVVGGAGVFGWEEGRAAVELDCERRGCEMGLTEEPNWASRNMQRREKRSSGERLAWGLGEWA